MQKSFILPLMFTDGVAGRQRRTLVPCLAAGLAWSCGVLAQGQMAMSMPPPLAEVVYVCPFDRSIRSLTPGNCEQRGRHAELVAEVPEVVDFPVSVTTEPATLRPAEPAQLLFTVRDPWQGKIVEQFTAVHESLFHLFLVSEDLEYFEHAHPRLHGQGFELTVRLPRPGHYRTLADFLPEAALPQLVTTSLFVAGEPMAPPTLHRDYAPKETENLSVAIEVTPPQPIAGKAASVRFTVAPASDLELYVGAPAHLFVASDDLIDLIHAHPLPMMPSATVDFSVLFPRARTYRVWVQFQRDGVVNTARFDVPVRSAEP
jgi:hypothetical protein